jgi:DNA-binding transcriptional ArsR family regulator
LIYDIFNNMNVLEVEQVSNLLGVISPTPRLLILLAIGGEDPCVCHLETTFGWRQAYLSQHLMALRKEGILETVRKGRNIHYKLKNPEFLKLINLAARIRDVKLPDLVPSPNCSCPNCRGGDRNFCE